MESAGQGKQTNMRNERKNHFFPHDPPFVNIIDIDNTEWERAGGEKTPLESRTEL